MMKVLFTSSGNSKYGLSPIVKNQGDSLIKKNIKLDYFLISRKGILGYVSYLLKLKRKLSTDQYDIIHAHYGLTGIISQFAHNKEKLIVSFMGDDLLGSINKNGKMSLPGRLLVLLNKLFITRYDYIIVKSKQLSQELRLSINNEIIPNGVDLTTFIQCDKKESRQKLNIAIDKKLIIFVSNPNRPEKNYNLARKATKLVNCESLGLIALSGLSKEQLSYYYSAADLLLLTSDHEGSPNVIKEAMACNCPIVSTDVGDVRWTIGNTDGCYLTNHNAKDIAEKIELALDFSEKFDRTKGRKRITELGLDSETIAKRIIGIYEKVLSS